jgi:hypothetical protein
MLKILILLFFISFKIAGQKKSEFVIMKGLPFSLSTYTSVGEEDIDMINGKSRFDIIDTIWNVAKIKMLNHKLRKMIKITKKKHEDYDLRLALYFYKNGIIKVKYFFDSNQNIIWNDRLYKIKKYNKVDIFNILPKPIFKDGLVNEDKFWNR